MNNLNEKIQTAVFKFRLKHKLGNRALLRDTITTSTWSTIGKAAGFLIPFFIAAWFGVNSETDAFFFAYTIIVFFAAVFSPVVETVVVPFIAEAKVKGENIGLFLGNVLVLTSLALLIISAVLLLFVKPVLSFSSKFSAEALDLIFLILLESAPLLLLIVWTSILAGTLNAYKDFAAPALSPAFRAVATLAFIFIFKEKMGIHAVAWGYVVGETFRLFLLFLVVYYKNYFHLTFSFDSDKKFIGFFKTSSYQILAMTSLASAPLINKTMVTWLGVGGVSVLEYADRLFLVPANLLLIGVVTTILSYWSDRHYSNPNNSTLKKDVYRIALWAAAFSVFITVVVFLLKTNLIELVYGHGKFPKDKLRSVEAVFTFYMIGLVFHAIHHVFVRGHLVLKNTRTIMITALIMGLLNVILNLIFMKLFGVPGIALATTSIYGISIVLLYREFNRYFEGNRA